VTRNRFGITFGWSGALCDLLERLARADVDRTADGGFVIRGEILTRVGEQHDKERVLVPTSAQAFKQGHPVPLVDLLEEDSK
jgi:hypothetical protein